MKRVLCIAALSAAAIWTGFAAVPRVKRVALAAMEKSFDGKLEKLGAEDSFMLLGNTRGVYLEGYGAVFTAEVNLFQGPSITPFRQSISKDDVSRVHARKVQQIPGLKRKMRDMLADSAASLDTVPSNERIALGVSLFYYSWEDMAGLPRQILMHAEKRKLLDRAINPESYVEVAEF